ncbi:hypothetical protein [Butyrivibrio sp. WCE2006]|uniref:hypothetical protein n=1 Tax=Butyrivibrio sp. WCE2006 TaxID=1410611 RepID=UPI0005D158AC|nr:hypothetical protein [Butyrivibrio sp. WCE2006]
MFTEKDIQGLGYFEVMSLSETIELLSRNTLHCWMIYVKGTIYELYHKHSIFDEYHHQTDYGSLFDCILDIVLHDEYQMNGRKNPKYNAKSYVDELITIYR